MQEVILVKLGEIVLKGLNRRTFEQKLINNIRRRLAPIGSPAEPGIGWRMAEGVVDAHHQGGLLRLLGVNG